MLKANIKREADSVYYVEIINDKVSIHNAYYETIVDVMNTLRYFKLL